jgi:chromate reductase, NAD(P)H dehydrogenase (quinone)
MTSSTALQEDRGDRRLQILGLPGSLRPNSLNRRVLEIAQKLVPEGVGLAIWDGLKDLAPFDEDDEASPSAGVVALREAIASADGVLIATPEYNSSLPGQLKNAFDWASRPYPGGVLAAKPIAVVSASPLPTGAASAQADARRILTRVGAVLVDAELSIPRAHEVIGNADVEADPILRQNLSEILQALCEQARTNSAPTAA